MLHALNNNFESIQELRERGYGAADFNVKKAKVMFFPDEAGVLGTLYLMIQRKFIIVRTRETLLLFMGCGTILFNILK